MAELLKTSSSAVDSKSKGKRSVLDEEIGKDFLSSWKSMSVTQDNAMDFTFETISKGKKKPINFDKLDMDFNLDGDLDNLSSFKMDMPDLDFSSPSKHNAKAKEKSKEETNSGKQQEKKDRFAFSFDFHELDGFDFYSSLMKGEKTCKKTQDSEAVACEGSEVPKIDQEFEDDFLTAKLPASKDGTNSKGETSKGGAEACNGMDDPFPSRAVPLQGLVPGDLVAEQGSRISPEKTMDSSAKESNKSSPLSDRAVSSELYDHKSLQSSLMDSLSGNNSSQEIFSDLQAEVCSQGRRINTSLAPEQNVSEKTISNEVSIHDNLYQKNSFMLPEIDRDDRKEACGNILAEMDDSRSAQGDIILKDISTASLSREISENTGAKKDIQNPTPKFSSVSSDSEPTVAELTPRKNKEAGTIRSRFFRRSEETKSQLHQPSTGKEVSSFSRKKIGDMHLCSANEKREDTDGSEAQNGKKIVDYSKLSSQELTKGRSTLLQSENIVGSSSNIRDIFYADAVQNGGSKLIGKSSLKDTATTKREPVLLRSEKNASLRASPPNHTEKTESGSQISVNPKHEVAKIESIQKSKFLSEAYKIAKKAPDLSISKSSRTLGLNMGQLSSQKETNSLRNLEQNKDTPGTVGNAEKLTPQLTSLKRKTFEESNGDLMVFKPLKRLSQSTSESRNLNESNERVADKEVQNHKNHVEDSAKDIVCDHLPSGSKVPWEVTMTELEFPSIMESDGNVEKAEAYGKELEDICNMLKKKHDEAKEILVRAVVNNNNLLMLNHPVFKEKVHMVQKISKLLISKEMPT